MKNRNEEKATKLKMKRKSGRNYFDYTEVKESPTELAARLRGPRYESDKHPFRTRLIDLAGRKNPTGLMTSVWNAGFFIKMHNSYHFSVLCRAN